jgi:hypothetical protein
MPVSKLLHGGGLEFGCKIDYIPHRVVIFVINNPGNRGQYKRSIDISSSSSSKRLGAARLSKKKKK